MKRIPIVTVIGSINMDLFGSTTRSPKVGETILGDRFHKEPGGKGTNQAVAASRLGAHVQMIGRVGDDDFGKQLLNNLVKENVDTEGVSKVPNQESGVAMITLTNHDNSIVVIPGANNFVTPEYVQDHEDLIKRSDIVLVQLEIPMDTIEHTATLCHKHHIPLVLNPAPANKLQQGLLEKTTFITPNEIEREQIFPGNEREVLNKWKNKLIITKGKRGVLFMDKDHFQEIPVYHVKAVDTTGAGDTFNGAFVYYWVKHQDLYTACKMVNVASALAVQQIGAQTGMPTDQEVAHFLSTNPS
ncbi:ribokinase [Gracilibacillus salitolerans]|uniref:Ribokinase n=1 Tax=Gracilibacillus salitolerans TaxID=2663022 RepID=A0A5Q2TN75_9BACI|nr:ribokinase [Gracilibacillus salitolerans]QGH36246.1 ribokinase [Gracilibacillus salitolerans]